METATEISSEELTERVLDWEIGKEFLTPRDGVILRVEGYDFRHEITHCTNHSIDQAILALSAAALGHDDVAKKALGVVMNRKSTLYNDDAGNPKTLMRKEDGLVLDHLSYSDCIANLPVQFFWALALNRAGNASQVSLARRILDKVEKEHLFPKDGLIDKPDFFDVTGKRIFGEGTHQYTAEVNTAYALAVTAIRGSRQGQRVIDNIRSSPLYDTGTGLLVSDFAEKSAPYSVLVDGILSYLVRNHAEKPEFHNVADRIYPFENVWYAFTLGAQGSVKEGREVFERMEQAGCYLDSGLYASFVSIKSDKPETYSGFCKEALNACVIGVIAMKLLGLNEEAERMSEALRGMPDNLPWRSSCIDPAYDPSTGLLYNGTTNFGNLVGEFSPVGGVVGEFSHNPSLNCLWAVSQHERAPQSFIVRR